MGNSISIRELARILPGNTTIVIFGYDRDGEITEESEILAKDAAGLDFEVWNVAADDYNVITCDAEAELA